MFESIFKLGENKITVRTEVLAGITTFLTMAYIIFVNPDILSKAGMPRDAVFASVCIAATPGCALIPERAGAGHGAEHLFRLWRGWRHGPQLVGGAGLRRLPVGGVVLSS